MKMRTAVNLLLLGCLAVLPGCRGGLGSAVEKGELAPKFEDTKVDKKYLWVRGLAASNPEHTTKMQKRAMSREAAIANAYQRSVEYVKGAGVIANVRVQDAISRDSTIETRVNGLVRGGEIFSSEYTNDDGCTVILRIPRESFKTMNIEFPETAGN
ncbi:MAG: hypothetical protein ABIG11_05870 [bacterium]